MELPPFRWSDLAIIIGIVVFIGIMGYLILSLKQDTLECLSNPLNYTMDKTGWICSCWNPELPETNNRMQNLLNNTPP